MFTEALGDQIITKINKKVKNEFYLKIKKNYHVYDFFKECLKQICKKSLKTKLASINSKATCLGCFFFICI